MPQVSFGDYTITFSPDEMVQIRYKDTPDNHFITKCAVDFDDDEDILVISQYNPTFVAATTKYFRLLVGHTDDANDEDPENSGRYELYFRSSEDQGFFHLVVFRLGVPRAIAQNMAAFLQNPDNFHENPPNYLTNNNNNNNNNNNAETIQGNAGSVANNVPLNGGRRRKTKRIRKQRRRRN